jgi:hypothetical protein
MLRGMNRFGRDDRLRLLDRWERSGLSAAAFAPSVGVSPWTLYAWRRSARRVDRCVSPSGFIELAVRERPSDSADPCPETGPEPCPEPDVARCGIEVALPRGIAVRVATGFDSDTLRRVVDALLA